MFHFVRTFGAQRDVLITASGVVIRALGDRRRHPYIAAASLGVLGQVLAEVGLTALHTPKVAAAPEGTLSIYGPPARGALVWLIPLEFGVELRYRAPIDAMPAEPADIPPHGPLALPSPWVEPPIPAVQWVDGADVSCPHCAATSEVFRRIEGAAFACPHCSRSFVDLTLAARAPQV